MFPVANIGDAIFEKLRIWKPAGRLELVATSLQVFRSK
jgi:hypothetical protein